MAKQPPKRTLIIDADLHVQNPEDIILSYFNTSNVNDLIVGSRTTYLIRFIVIFALMVIMKFFFDEMLPTFWSFLITLILSVIGGIIFVLGAYFAVAWTQALVKADSIRGLFWNIFVLTIIVLLIGVFV